MPPPDIIPYYCQNHEDITQEVLSQYRNRYIYIWMYQGDQFWYYPVRVEGDCLCGYAWTGEGWEYRQVSWRNIDAFY